MRLTSGDDDILLVSKSGHASRFSEEKVRPMGRDTSGVKGMNVSAKVNGEPNRVLAMDIARDDSELFVVTENGYGKRTQVSEYPVKGRGTKGVLTAKLTAKKGGLAGALIVREHQDLLFISQNGMVQRTRAGGISQMGRPTQGVKVMNMKDDDLRQRRRPGRRDSDAPTSRTDRQKLRRRPLASRRSLGRRRTAARLSKQAQPRRRSCRGPASSRWPRLPIYGIGTASASSGHSSGRSPRVRRSRRPPLRRRR